MTPTHPTRDDPVVGALSEGIGGRMGRRGGHHPWWTPVRVLLALTALTFALGMVQKAPCYAKSWQDGQQVYAQMCYSDLPYLYTGRGLAELNWPYTGDEQVRDRYEVMEYPVGISYFAWGAAWVTHWLSGSPDLDDRLGEATEDLGRERDILAEMRLYVAVSAVGLALAALLSTWFLAGVNPGRPWDAAGFALAPTLALAGLINWDLLAVVFVAGALWAWARDRPVLTGVMIGLGTATKLYPFLLLGGLLVICWRERRWRDLLITTGAAVGSWVIANLPALLTGPEQWRVFWSFNSGRGADWGTLWLLVSQAGDVTFAPETINRWSWLLLFGWCVAVLVIGLSAPATPRLAQLGFLVVAGFLLVNKVYSPQYVLWLLPLAALARPRWRDLLIWQAGEILYFAAIWWNLGGYLDPPGDGDPGFYWLGILARVVATLYLVAIVVRDVLRPEHDPVTRRRFDRTAWS